MVRNLILYGAGKRCRRLCRILKDYDCDYKIIAISDGNAEKWGSEVEGYQVEPLGRIKELKDASICITVLDMYALNDIRRELQQVWNYDLNKEVYYNEVILELYKGNEDIKHHISRNMEGYTHREESVLFACINGFILGGIEAWTKDICEALIKSGKKNIYVIANKGDYAVPSLLQDNMIYTDVQEPFFQYVLNVIDAIMKMLPCKVITTQADGVMLAASLIKLYYPEMIEIIATVRGANELTYCELMAFQEMPDIYIGVSQDIKNDLIQRGIEAEKVFSMCVPFECEKELVRTYTENSLLPIRIGYAGRMVDPDKRMDLLLKLLAELEERKVYFKVELAGDGSVREEMERFVTANQLTDKVKFLGKIPRSEIPAFWKRQDICVNIADFEGRSHSIIEAMGNGAVPVVTATSGVREDITDDVNGYIIPLGDYHTMADRITYLAEHRERLAEMGKLAHDVVYPKSLIENHLKFWEDILSHKVW